MKEHTRFQPPLSVRAAKFFFLFCASMLSAIAFLYLLARDFPYNRSASMPRGFYRITSQLVTREAIVGACVPEPYATLVHARGYLGLGSCSNGLRPVMKYVAAIPGDTVEVQLSGIFVNGNPISNTKILSTDSLGRAVPNQVGIHIVRANEYWLVSNHNEESLDSRYFGPVTEILGVVELFFTEKELCSFRFLQKYLRC